MHTRTDESPQLSVIFHLGDERCWAERTLAAWLAQHGGTERFEIVVVNDRPGADVEAFRRRLRQCDQLVTHRSANEAVLYNVGARVARGSLILFTESHAIPEPDVARHIIDHFARNADDAANLGSSHISTTPFARLDEILYERETPKRSALGAWRCVGLRGFAIRASAFREFGPFAEVYERFAETVLAINLHRAGRKIGAIPQARVYHVNGTTLRSLVPHMREGFRGECMYWQHEPRVMEQYFGQAPPWLRLGIADTTSARQACAAVMRSWWSDIGRPGWRRKFFGALRLLPWLLGSALLGSRWVLVLAWAQAVYASWRMQQKLGLDRRLPCRGLEDLLLHYLKARQAWARFGAAEVLAGRPLSPAPELAPHHGVRLAELDGRSLIGFFPREYWDNVGYHWSLPVAVLRLRIEPGDYRLHMDIHATGPFAVRCPRWFFNRHAIDPADVCEEGGSLSFAIRRDQFEPGAEQRLTLTCAPSQPREVGLPDPRDLGVALFGIDLQPLPATASAIRPTGAAA